MVKDSAAQTAYGVAMMGDLKDGLRPPRLAHYTSIATLESILKSKELWFSNPLYMNDLEELRFGIHEGALAFRNSEILRAACGSAESYDRLIDHFNQLCLEFDMQHALDVYVLCMSEQTDENSDGALSMWRGYGSHGTGAALLLDTEKFLRYSVLPIIADKVQYATSNARKEWLTNKVAALAEQIARHEKSENNLQAAAHLCFERIKLFSLFTKHIGFSEENEWRAVYVRQRDQSDQLGAHLSYAITPRGVEPKLKLPLIAAAPRASDASGGEDLFAGVILGPSQSSQLAQASIRRMVNLLGFPELANNIYASSIPFRG